MRTFFVRLRDSDMSAAGNVYTSDVYDLYQNDWYKNFSVTRTLYGLNSLGNGTWTGLHNLGGGATDAGLIEDGRFIDTTGRIDVVSWSVEIDLDEGQGPASATLVLYTADAPSAVFPDEFVQAGPYSTSTPIDIIGAPRYLKAEVTLDVPVGSVLGGFEGLLRVEIDRPVIAPKFRSTQRMLDNFPEWMALREYQLPEPATPETATPTSLGAQFLNSVASEWIEDLFNSITYSDLQKYIDSADLNQVAWVYRQDLPNESLYNVYNPTTDLDLAQAADLDEFYGAILGGEEAVYYWDENDDVIYVPINDELLLNGAEPIDPPRPHHVWNSFDDIGYTVDLKRLHLEGNDSFQKRILDVYRNKPGVGMDNFKKALRRELNIWSAYGATPNSDYLGATPEVLEMADLEIDPLYTAPDGMPTQRFVALVDQLAIDYPTTWGRFRWDRTYWDIGGPNHEGYKVLPYRMDATPLLAVDVQAGVGDLDDLLILRPDAITGPHDFTARLIMRGKEKTERSEYPPVEFDIEIYGRSERLIYNNPSNTVWLTLDLTAGGVHYFHAFQLTAKSDVDVDRPSGTSASHVTYRFLDEAVGTTDTGLVFARMNNGAAYNGTGVVPFVDITNVVLKAGKWDVGTQTYTLTEGADTFDAWFSNDPNTVLTFNAGAPSLTGGTNMPVAPVVMRSKQVSSSVGDWETERFPHTIRVNTATPATTETVPEVPLPSIVWDPYETDSATREVLVQITTKDSATGDYGATTTNEAGASIFLPATYLRFRMGSASPVTPSASTGLVVFPDFNDFTFWAEDGALYPITATVWDLFEAVQTTPIEGIVDENGPWRYGNPSAPGNTNFVLQAMEVDRNDFGVPNTDDYVITWMGVEVLDDPRVIAWLDTNTVKPAVVDASDVTYPPNAIVEELNAGVYTYTPFVMRARLQPQPSPEWNPYIHSGWYYQGGREGYVYAEPVSLTTTGASRVLSGVARQGAPIIVWSNEATPEEMRQVTFLDEDGELTLTNVETVKGTGTNKLYLAYENIYDIVVTDTANGQAVAAGATSTTNQVTISSGVTDRKRQYEVTYKVYGSFYADNDYIHTDGTRRTQLIFSHTPASIGATSYGITYESSRFDPATPIDLPLSPLYSSLSESFVFLSHNEYTLDRVEVIISPRKIVADGQDYMLVSLKSFDQFGNPKPDASFTLSTNFGTLDDTTLTTDRDGYASAVLTSGAVFGASTGTLTVSGAVSANVVFEIEPAVPAGNRLIAAVSSEQIPANGKATNMVFGRVENDQFVGQAAETVNWKRARSLYELFAEDAPDDAELTPQISYSFVSLATPVVPPPSPVIISTQTVNDSEGEHEIVTTLQEDEDDPGSAELVITTTTTFAPPDLPFEGSVVTDANGYFQIGPFTASGPDEPGCWFVSVELDDEAGDVVFWNEHPDNQYGPTPGTHLPRPSVQALAGDATPYATHYQFPSYYDEATPYAPATPVTTIWLPPKWFAMSKYLQYQLGLLGNTRGQVTYGPNTHEFRRVI